MLKERAKAIAYWVWTADLVLTTGAFFLAWWLRSFLAPQLAPTIFPTELYPFSRYLGLLPLVLAIWTFLLVTREAYTSRRTVALAVEAWQVFQVVGAGVKHTTSQRLVHLCDHYIYYDQLAAAADQMMGDQLAEILQRATDQLLQDARLGRY